MIVYCVDIDEWFLFQYCVGRLSMLLCGFGLFGAYDDIVIVGLKDCEIDIV